MVDVVARSRSAKLSCTILTGNMCLNLVYAPKVVFIRSYVRLGLVGVSPCFIWPV